MDEQEQIDRDLVRPNHLDWAIFQYGAEKLLIAGRWLQIFGHDREAEEHMHWYRQILENYDPETQTVLLSERGSRRLRKELDTPDRKYHRDELFDNPELAGSVIRGRDYILF